LLTNRKTINIKNTGKMHRVESFFYFDFLEISPTTVIECFAIQPSTFSYCMYSYVSRSWTQATDRTLY